MGFYLFVCLFVIIIIISFYFGLVGLCVWFGVFSFVWVFVFTALYLIISRDKNQLLRKSGITFFVTLVL